MHLGEIVDDFKKHFETVKTDAETYLTQHLPALAGLADQAAANPLVDAVLKAVHLSPEMLTALAEMINKADAEVAVYKQAQDAQSAPAEPDPAPADDASLPQAV